MKHEYLLFGLVFNKPTIEQVIKKLVLSQNFKSSRSDGFYKKGVLRNFPKFTGKHPCQSLFFNKVAGRPATLLTNRLWHRCFPVNFGKFPRTLFYRTTLVAAFGMLQIKKNKSYYNTVQKMKFSLI